MMVKTFYILFIIIVYTSIIDAQYNNLKFESYSIRDGLSSTTCLEIFQDSKEYLWFGTIDGLNKFNGYNFEIYRPLLNDPYSISNNRINTITEDAKGNLWIGTSNGLNVFDTEKEKFYRIYLNKNEKNDFTLTSVINDLYFDAESNRIWVATGNGACQISLKQEAQDPYKTPFIKFYSNDVLNSNSLDNNTVANILKDKEGNLWFGTAGKYLNKYIPEDDNFQRIRIDVENIYKLDHLPNVLIEDNEGDIWIGNDLSRLVLWEKSKNQFQTISLSNSSIPIFDIYVDRKGFFWIATDGYGIFLYDKSLKKIKQIKHEQSDPFSLPNNQISKIIEDAEGIFWLATYNEGICKLALIKSNFEYYFHQTGNKNSLSTKIAQSILEDSKGRIWIGTDGGGLNLFELKSKKIQHYTANESNTNSLSSNKILYLEESYDGNIWVCTWDGGLNSFNPSNQKFKQYLNNPSDSNSLGQNTVWCAKEDDYHGVWLGTQTSGLNYLIPNQNKFLRFLNNPNDSNSLNSNFVFSLFIDSKKRLLIGTSLGLDMINLFKVYQNSFKNIRFNTIKNRIIQGNRINFITEDHLGNIWLGSDLGLHKLNNKLEYLNTYTTSNGLPNNLIVGIQEDDYGFLWITSKGGLSRMNPQSDEFKNFNIHDGLQGMEFQSKSIDKTRDGKIIIGGINGINIFNPKNFLQNSDTIVPVLTRMRLFNKVVHAGDTINNRVLLNHSIAGLSQLELKYNEGYLSFDFVALYFQNPERVQYAYQMINFDDELIISGLNRTANYSNLPPGEYIFEVKASQNMNWENALATSLYIKIQPPPWKTWWAYILYIAIFSILTWFGLKYYTKIVKEEKERELDQMKLRFFINVAHEFRTPLTLILNPIDKIISSYKNAELVKESSLVIQRSARRLLNLVNQLLDFRKMEMGETPLEIENDDIIKFCKDIVLLFEDLAKVKNIKFSFESLVESIYMDFDPDKMEKILTNLLSNAIKYTQMGGEIFFSISLIENNRLIDRRKSSDSIEISVRDTGVGIKKEHLDKVFNRFFNVDSTNTGTGIGLNFTKGLVELHGGDIRVESEYQKGSTFIVSLPRYIRQVVKLNKNIAKVYSHNIDAIQSVEYELSISDNGEEPDYIDNTDIEHKNTPTLLIVEDNKELRVHLKKELSSHFKIREAVNGAQGLEIVNKYYPDIIISDVMMPEMDGFELCRRIKTELETCHIPVILLTARSLEEDRIEGYKTGADEYLPKPFNMDVLKARINNLLELKRKLREKFASIGGIVPSSEMTSNSLDEAFLDKATKIVLDNIYNVNFVLETLLTEMGISRSRFFRKINSITGQNPSNFIRTIRLKFAAEMLLEEKYAIKEIAYNCGFNSPAYFSKTFRELFGLTPQQYIEQNKK